MSAVEMGGHLVIVTTRCNNHVGHGFYQFSPELFFRTLSPENGFEMRAVLVRARHRWGRWRQVLDPVEAGQRVEMTNAWPTLIYAVARRVSDQPIFASWPQQSDYVAEWKTGMGKPGRGALLDPDAETDPVAPERWLPPHSAPQARRDHFRSVKLTGALELLCNRCEHRCARWPPAVLRPRRRRSDAKGVSD